MCRYRELPTREYESKKYRKSTNLFKFHSWAPLYVDLDDPSIEELELNPGLMLMSQNLLSTATTVLGYEYNLEKKDHFLHAAFTYSGWYPVLKVSADYGGLPYVRIFTGYSFCSLNGADGLKYKRRTYRYHST